MECHRTFKRSGCYGKSGLGVSGLNCTNLVHYCKTNRPQLNPTHNHQQHNHQWCNHWQPKPQRCNPKHNPWCNQPIQPTNAFNPAAQPPTTQPQTQPPSMQHCQPNPQVGGLGPQQCNAKHNPWCNPITQPTDATHQLKTPTQPRSKPNATTYKPMKDPRWNPNRLPQTTDKLDFSTSRTLIT